MLEFPPSWKGVVMERDQAIYFAGLFDGEGCIRIGKNRITGHTSTPHYYLQVILANQNLAILEELHVLCCGGHLQKGPGCYRFHLASNMAAKFLLEIQPFSKIKQPEIVVALAFQLLQETNSSSRKRKSDEYMLILDGFRQRLSDLKRVDKDPFKVDVNLEFFDTSEGGENVCTQL